MSIYGTYIQESYNNSRYTKINYKDKERTIMFSDSFKTDFDKRKQIFDNVIKEVKKAVDNEKKLLNIIYSSKEVADIVEDMDKRDIDENYLDWFEIYESDSKDKFDMAVYTKYGQLVLDKVKSGNGNSKNVRYND